MTRNTRVASARATERGRKFTCITSAREATSEIARRSRSRDGSRLDAIMTREMRYRTPKKIPRSFHEPIGVDVDRVKTLNVRKSGPKNSRRM